MNVVAMKIANQLDLQTLHPRRTIGQSAHRHHQSDSRIPVASRSSGYGSCAPIHVHMLGHSCGYALANEGHDTQSIQDWLGPRAIRQTVRYKKLTPARLKVFWR
jgi:site-specific recombinase XerD